MHFRMLLAAVVSVCAAGAYGDLDRIAADGVTERGGSPAYARMLPRTKADGVLDASLLPPVADWASQPISNLYYAAGNARVQGNGSPQYPFRSLTYAFANMAPNSAVLLAPATYSGTLPLDAGRTVTIAGFGPMSRIESLSVVVSGASYDTCLALVGVDIGTLSVSGGRVNIKMSSATVERLEGSSTMVTVTRLDLGSVVGISSLVNEDVYAGYDTVPKAEALVDPVSGDQVILSGGRALVTDGGVTHVVAYVSDIDGATNDIGTALQALSSADSSLSSRINTEAYARASGDIVLSNMLNNAQASLAAQIASVGTSWGGQLSTVALAIDGLRDELQAHEATASNALASVNQAISGVQSGYTSADSALRADIDALGSRFSVLEGGIEAAIDARARTIADSRISAARSGIISNAVSQADSLAATRVATLSQTVTANRSELVTRMSSIEGELISIKHTLNDLIDALAGASSTQTGSFTNYYRATLPQKVP